MSDKAAWWVHGIPFIIVLTFYVCKSVHNKRKRIKCLEKNSEVDNIYLLFFFPSETNLGFGLKGVAHLREQLVHSVWCYCFTRINFSLHCLRLCLICLTSGLTQRHLWLHQSRGWLLNDWKNNWNNVSLGKEESKKATSSCKW